MKTIVFTGGGTAGHIMPNLALMDRLKHEYNCVYVGTAGMEKELCKARGIEFYTVDAVKLNRDRPLSAITLPLKLRACVKNARGVLDKISPSLVFGKGGYAALPASLAARCPLICHESDITPGLTTRLCARKAQSVLCAFEPCAARIKKGRYVGAPLDQKLFKGVRDPGKYGFSGNRPILGVVGGSSGAAALNSALADALPELVRDFDVIHITGKGKPGAESRAGYVCKEFEYDMPSFYATADCIVTRAGANALFECIALKLPALAVPLEKASRGDQMQNAEHFKSLGAIDVLRERDITASSLISHIKALLANKSDMISAMQGIKTDGTSEICGIIKETLGSV